MKNIAIVAGGDSSEWVISVQSAAQVAAEMKRLQYNAWVVQVRGASWDVIISDNEKASIDKNDFRFLLNGSKTTFDYALIAIHGTPGENGLLQSYFEMLSIPYTTCGVLASALTFNKYVCKVFLKEFGVKSAKAVLVKKNQKTDKNQIINTLGFPCFVKPNESGSSFGVSKINSADELEKAINHALTEGEEVIIEEFIKGTEVTCGVLKTKKKELVLPITEVISKKEFFDYEAKYTPGLSEEITPARISPDLTSRVQALTSKIYDALNCKGIVRIDYIISNDELYFLEVNTVPGMSPNSIVPKQLKEIGMSLGEAYQLIFEDLDKK